MWQCNGSFIWQRQQQHAGKDDDAEGDADGDGDGDGGEGDANNLQAVAKLCFHLAQAVEGNRGSSRRRRGSRERGGAS